MMQKSPPNLAAYRHSTQRQSRRRLFHKPGQFFRERYRVLKVLASGGFGVTYLAQDGGIPGSPLCVIKQLCPKANSEAALERAKRRFRQEAKVLSRVGSHSQIPRLLDYFTVKEGFYLVQEYIPGDVLTQEVRSRGKQPERQVKQFLMEILPVVKFIHRCRIIHRDIKPPNIIRCKDDNRLVLIDFGAVRECLGTVDNNTGFQNPMTHFVGTPGFAPPEQRALRPTYASDIYALGMTCLFLLTARTPAEFDVDANTGDVLWHHLVDVSNHFSSILTKMLEPDVAERYQTVDDVMRSLVLENYMEQLSVGLSHQPQRPGEHGQDLDAIARDGYVSPVQRQAIGIRRWRSRKQKRYAQSSPQTGFSMTTGTASPNRNF